MKLKHIGLNIASASEVDYFYRGILKCWPENNTEVSEGLSKEVFQQDGDANIFTVRNSELTFKLFLTEKGQENAFNHLCIEVGDREHIAEKARAFGYPVVRIKQDSDELLFVKDKAGNIFELISEGT